MLIVLILRLDEICTGLIISEKELGQRLRARGRCMNFWSVDRRKRRGDIMAFCGWNGGILGD